MDDDNGNDKDRTDEPPADGPSGGSAGEPKEEKGSSSYDKPGDGEADDSGKQSPK